MKKAHTASEAREFGQIPNIGEKVAAGLAELGLNWPKDLKGKDAYALYVKLGRRRDGREDPCLLDVYMSAIDFMNGGNPKPWWFYTKERKKKYPNL